MATLILVIAEQYPDHWAFARDDGFWDTRRNPGIKPGDDVFFWQGGHKRFVGWVRALSDSHPLPRRPQARWHDVESGGYQYRFTFEVVADVERSTTWGEMAKAASVTALPSNGIVHVPDSGAGYLRGLFRS